MCRLFSLIGTLATAEAAGHLTQVGPWMSLGLARPRPRRFDGNFAYVVTDLGLKIVDLSDMPPAPVPRARRLRSTLCAGKSFGVGLKLARLRDRDGRNYVYVANQTKDLQIIDVSNPAAPVLVGDQDPAGIPRGTWP